jgi:hypothetical protein
MEKCKGVREHNGEGMLFSVEGTVVFSETRPANSESFLVLKLKRLSQEIWWTHQSTIPAYIPVDFAVRGFYQNRDGDTICLKAYELLDKGGRVLTRAAEAGYLFVD